MSEGFELGPFHVPQQSRRDKLRSLEGLHPALYDPMITDAVLHHHHPPPPPLLALPPPVKPEGRFNLMGFPPAGDRADHHLPHFLLASTTTTTSSSSSSHHHHLVDLPPSLAANPSSSYICPGQAFEQPLLGGSSNRLLYKPSFPVATTHQGLSLSLSSQTFNPDASSAPPPAMDNYIVIGGDPSRSIGPLGPFTGYSEVLKGSRFLKPAQQLLEEFCDVGQRAYYLESISPPDVDMDMADHSTGVGSSGGDHGEYSRRKTRLVSMLNEVRTFLISLL